MKYAERQGEGEMSINGIAKDLFFLEFEKI
jgi:hypothetical protein